MNHESSNSNWQWQYCFTFLALCLCLPCTIAIMSIKMSQCEISWNPCTYLFLTWLDLTVLTSFIHLSFAFIYPPRCYLIRVQKKLLLEIKSINWRISKNGISPKWDFCYCTIRGIDKWFSALVCPRLSGTIHIQPRVSSVSELKKKQNKKQTRTVNSTQALYTHTLCECLCAWCAFDVKRIEIELRCSDGLSNSLSTFTPF